MEDDLERRRALHGKAREMLKPKTADNHPPEPPADELLDYDAQARATDAFLYKMREQPELRQRSADGVLHTEPVFTEERQVTLTRDDVQAMIDAALDEVSDAVGDVLGEALKSIDDKIKLLVGRITDLEVVGKVKAATSSDGDKTIRRQLGSIKKQLGELSSAIARTSANVTPIIRKSVGDAS